MSAALAITLPGRYRRRGHGVSRPAIHVGDIAGLGLTSAGCRASTTISARWRSRSSPALRQGAGFAHRIRRPQRPAAPGRSPGAKLPSGSTGSCDRGRTCRAGLQRFRPISPPSAAPRRCSTCSVANGHLQPRRPARAEPRHDRRLAAGPVPDHEAADFLRTPPFCASPCPERVLDHLHPVTMSAISMSPRRVAAGQ
jgi:hypothetical protein